MQQALAEAQANHISKYTVYWPYQLIKIKTHWREVSPPKHDPRGRVWQFLKRSRNAKTPPTINAPRKKWNPHKHLGGAACFPWPSANWPRALVGIAPSCGSLGSLRAPAHAAPVVSVAGGAKFVWIFCQSTNSKFGAELSSWWTHTQALSCNNGR